MYKLSIVFFGDTCKYKKEIKTFEFKKLLHKFCLLNQKTEKKGLINIVFVNDVFIQNLNKKWRKINKPTDVLSFSNICDKEFPNPKNMKEEVLGEIFISLETAKRQSAEYNNTLQEEVNKLLVHGILHIFGYDHETEKDFFEMNILEKNILNDCK